MDNRYIYHYGSMRDFKTLKHADWGTEPSSWAIIGSSMVFVCFMAIVLFTLLIVF